ncbi:kinase-like domain-containing protein [Panaeolus papilionaceus]|nr:kinase-like domain-containing protein [Panaeolus papilionaceus]
MAVRLLHSCASNKVDVVEGGAEGQGAVNPFLGDSNITKYSGTDMAGSHTDLDGMTCDAFAHFSLHDSDGSVVFVDIQGISRSPLFAGGNTASGRPTVFLFDLMAHSREQSMGLGDQGTEGIQKFCAQHTCNQICRALGLEETDRLAKRKGKEEGDDSDDGDTGDNYVSPKRPRRYSSRSSSSSKHSGPDQNGLEADSEIADPRKSSEQIDSHDDVDDEANDSGIYASAKVVIEDLD